MRGQEQGSIKDIFIPRIRKSTRIPLSRFSKPWVESLKNHEFQPKGAKGVSLDSSRSYNPGMDRSDPVYCEMLRYLLDRINYEKVVDQPYKKNEFKLARMAFLLDLLDNPQRSAPVIHVAGTKGKGSVSWLLAEAFRFSGRKTGLFTSPHLVDLEERFVIDGSPVAPEDLVQAVEQIRPAEEACSRSEHGPPTFFELTTALGWILFQEHATDVNVIEVGLGGRLDSTNVCDPALCVITSISYDHQQQLGNTLAEIAGEKAGIIKPSIPVIAGARAQEAAEVIRKTALNRGCPIRQLGLDFDVRWTPGSSQGSISTQDLVSRMEWIEIHSEKTGEKQDKDQQNNELTTPVFPIKMLGKHQADNGAIALAAWKQLQSIGWDLAESPIAQSLANTQVPARLEIISNDPTWILDTAHNEASIQALLDALQSHFPERHRTVVFACSKDKKYRRMLELLIPSVDCLILTQFHSNPRFTPVERLEEVASSIVESLRAKPSLATTAPITPARKRPLPRILTSPSLVEAVTYCLSQERSQFRTGIAQGEESSSKTDNPSSSLFTVTGLFAITGSFFIASEAKELLRTGIFQTHRP